MRYLPYNVLVMYRGGWPDRVNGPRIVFTWGHTMARALGARQPGPNRQVIDTIARPWTWISSCFLPPVRAAGTSGELALESRTHLRGHPTAPPTWCCRTSDLIVHQGGDGNHADRGAQGIPQNWPLLAKPDAESRPAEWLDRVRAAFSYQDLRHNREAGSSFAPRWTSCWPIRPTGTQPPRSGRNRTPAPAGEVVPVLEKLERAA